MGVRRYRGVVWGGMIVVVTGVHAAASLRWLAIDTIFPRSGTRTVPTFAATVAPAADWHGSGFGELIKRAKKIARVNKISEIDIP